MIKSSYFKIIGVIEIVTVFAGLIYFINLINEMGKIQKPTGFDLLICVAVIVFLVFFAPSFGLALWTLGELIKHKQTNEKELHELKKELNNIKDNIQRRAICSANNQITHSNTNQVTHSNTNQVTHKWRCDGCGTMISDYICPVCGKDYGKKN